MQNADQPAPCVFQVLAGLLTGKRVQLSMSEGAFHPVVVTDLYRMYYSCWQYASSPVPVTRQYADQICLV